MPTWKYTGKDVAREKAEQSLNAIKSACFGCDTHNPDCSIARAAGDVAQMTGPGNASVRTRSTGRFRERSREQSSR